MSRNLSLLKLVPFGMHSFWFKDRLYLLQGRSLPALVKMPNGLCIQSLDIGFDTLFKPAELVEEKFLDNPPPESRIAEATDCQGQAHRRNDRRRIRKVPQRHPPVSRRKISCIDNKAKTKAERNWLNDSALAVTTKLPTELMTD